MTARSPAFLHRSFEHEVLLQPFGFTNIAVALVPEKSDVRCEPVNEAFKRRWLLFVDHRRGLLGRTVLACPTRAEPAPRRRRSYLSYTRSTPTGSLASLETTFKLPAKSAEHPTTQREPASALDIKVRQDEGRRTGRRRSLPLLAECFSGSAGGTTCRQKLSEEDNHYHEGERGQDSLPIEGSVANLSKQKEYFCNGGESIPGAQLADIPSRGFTKVSSPLIKGAQLKETRSCSAVYGAPAAAPSVPEVQPLDRSIGDDKHEGDGGAVEILLHGLSRPFLVAAAAGGKSLGVFFVDHATTSDNSGKTTTTAAAVSSQLRTLDETERGESQHRPPASPSTNRSDVGRMGRLRFLRWGAEQPVTLVEDLRNPVALCVSSSDSSVFVLEEVLERKRCEDDDDHRDRDRDRPQQHPPRTKERYRVCRLDGARLCAWFTNEAARRSAVSGSDFATPHKRNGQADNGSIELNAGGECRPLGCAADDTILLDDESETEWETSSNSDGGDFDKRRHRGVSRSSVGARLNENRPGSAVHTRGRRRAVSFAQVLEMPSASARAKRKESHHPEKPVDMCVLTDGTIIVAFSRSAPLHGGTSIAESQGVLRAFPAADSARRKGLGNVGTALSSVGRVADEYAGHDVDDSWLVAEGLPVITGLAAGAGDAVYLSLCGARHDGAVTAIGALSTRQRRSLVRNGGPRKDLRSRTHSPKGHGELPTGRGNKLATGGGKYSGGVHRSDEGFVRIASGFATALAVDEDTNLFYITAESRGSCRALWCSVPGARNRRVASLGQNSPSAGVTAAGASPATAAGVPVVAKGQAEAVASRYVGEGESIGSCAELRDEERCCAVEDRHARKKKAQAEAVAAAAAAATALATKRAAALSAALIEDDDQAMLASRAGRKPLFASRKNSAGGLRAGEMETGFEKEAEDASGDERDDKEPVNIAVVSRCRPLLAREMRRGVRAAVFCDGNDIVVPGELLPNKRPRRFGFDRVFGPGTSQARVYAQAVYPVVRKMLDGFNCSVLAYGQTGSGKTFTMEGGLVDPTLAGKNSTTTSAAKADPENGDATAACEIEKIGVIPRAVHTIFREGGNGGTRRYWVYVSHMEIYNERLFDLLAPTETAEVAADDPAASSPPRSPSRRSRRSPSHRSPRIATENGSNLPQRAGRSPRAGGLKSPKRKLSPRNAQRSTSSRHAGGGGGGGGGGGIGTGLTIEEDRHLGVVVKGLTQVEVKSPEDIFAIIARSKSNRRTAETMCNVESSRSHGVFCVRVISAEPTPWGGEVTRDGRLSLVDLSGSENIKRSGAVGARAKEAAAIGQSLLALGRVIKALVQNAPHIPYRESKLTRVLGDSLGGNAFTAIILNITPNSGMLDETLNTLTYAKTAQSVQNTPKQRIANKNPTDEATTGGGGTDSVAASPGAPNLSCNVAKELARWREGAKSRALSSGLSQSAHIRPWEGKIPILAPPQASHRPFSGSHNDQAGDKALLSLPRRQDAERACRGENTRRRPATAGTVRTRSVAPTAGGSRGQKTKELGMTPRRGKQEGAAVASAALAGAGLLSSASENQLLLTGLSDHHHDELAVAWRVFDSTAAEWVHTTVLTHGTRCTPTTATGTRCDVAFTLSSVAAERQGQAVGGASFTTAAKSAIEEVFDRYNRGGKADRGCLVPAEISALQQIWTRPDVEPPPPRLQPVPKSARQTSPQVLTATDAFRARSVTATGGGGRAPVEVPEMSENDGPFDKRVLTRPAFVEFCRRAAARDAIFVRHFFRRTGYDCRLELTAPTIEATRELVASSARRRSKGSDHTAGGKHPAELASSESRQGSRSQSFLRRGGSLGGDGGKTGGKGIEPPTPAPASSSQERGLFAQGNDQVRCLASGGLVNPAELWLWTEDERDHGERQNLDGLLSRGGGAHVSRAATTAILGAFASTKGPCSATTTTTTDKENAGGISTAPARAHEECGTEAGEEASAGCLPEPATADDAENDAVKAASKSRADASTPLRRVAPAPGRGLTTGSTIAPGGPPARCEWCGDVVVAGGKASHSAAFCDEEVVRVPKAR